MNPPGPHRVLLVSHDASRTGAPTLLADFGEWLRGRGTDVATLLLGGGPLADRFASLGPTCTIALGVRGHPLGATGLALREAGAGRAADALDLARLRLALRRLGPVDAAWLSAAPSLRVLPAIDRSVPVVAHLHELAGVFDQVVGPGTATTLLGRCDRLVGGAAPVTGLLVERGADPSRVRLRDEFTPDPGPDAVAGHRRAGGALRARLGIPPDAPVVGAIATASRRKGIDLFVVLARMLADRPAGAAAHLVWVGGGEADLAWQEARADVATAGLADRVHLVGEQTDLGPWLGLFDVAVLTSREDSFPLVCLMAGLHEVPVVAFDTGIGDLLRRAGRPQDAVIHLNPAALADQVAVLLRDPAERRAAGTALAAAVRERHVTSVAAPRLAEILDEAAGWTAP